MPDGSWAAKTDMPAPGRAVMAHYKLANSKIYVAGGSTGSNSVCRDHDEYAALGDFWASMVDIPPPDRARCMGLALGPDTGYLIGGRGTGSSVYYDYCVEYSQTSGIWAAKANLPLNKGSGNSWVVDNDKGIVTAGAKGSGTSGLAPQTYEYTKSTDTWAVKTSIIPPGRESAAGFCIQGKGYVCGGGSTPSGLCSTVGDLYDTDVYDNATDSWASLTDMINPSRGMAGGESLASSGKGYIAGGSKSNYIYQDCDEFDPSTNNWISKTNIPVKRNGAAVCAGSDNTMYVIGSYVNPTSYTSVYEFTMPKAPRVSNLSPVHEQINVPVDSNILFNIFDDVGVDLNTITVKVGDSFAIVGGVFQPGFTGTITEIV